MIAFCHARDGLPGLDNHPRPFMPEDVRQRQGQYLLDNGDIGVTDPGCREFHEHLVGTRRLEPHRLDDERSVRSVDDRGLDFHDCNLSI